MASSTSPASSLVRLLTRELGAHLPFSEMQPEHVQMFVVQAQEYYFASDQLVCEPSSGPSTTLYWVRRGSVSGADGLAELNQGRLEYELGDLFPVSAVLAGQAVSSEYRAHGDTFCLGLPREAVLALAQISTPFADTLNRRVAKFLARSRAALQQVYAERSLTEHSLERSLDTLPSRQLCVCQPEDSLQIALTRMHERRIGSILIVDSHEAPQGILTRHDILGRITLPRMALETPISQVMSRGLITIADKATAQDAVLLMARHGIRHLPVVKEGRVVNMVSERDLFSLQRLSLKGLGTRLRNAGDLQALKSAAQDIASLARNLVGQGVQARQLTGMISHLNDVLTQRIVALVAALNGIDGSSFCWLSFGSEGRSEQTISTDQDNGLVIADTVSPEKLPGYLTMARTINEWLDACGYPLCKGNIMGSNPEWCQPAARWLLRFQTWVQHGSPTDILNAAIFFDLRPLAGNDVLALPLREYITEATHSNMTFLRLLAQNGQRFQVPLGMFGGLDTENFQTHEGFDLKLKGTAIVVDCARTLALAHGVGTTNTRERLEAVAKKDALPADEAEAAVAAFEILQMLRLRSQLEYGLDGQQTAGHPDNPNWLAVDLLNEIDRKMLKEALRVVRNLQQRVAMEYRLA